MTTITMNVYAYLEDEWVDITTSVYGINGLTADWGMSSNKVTDRLAKTGTVTFSLNNEGKDFLPSGASVVSADWKKGTIIKVTFTVLGITKTKFYATIDKIKLDAGELGQRKAHVDALDWMDYAINQPLNGFAVQLEKRADEGISTILAAMPIQPLATDIDTGESTFPVIFSDTTQKTRAYSEFQKLVDSEFGYFYNRADNTLVFERNSSRTGLIPYKQIRVPDTGINFLLQENGDKLLQENGDRLLQESFNDQDVFIDNEFLSADVSYGDELVNRVGFTANPMTIHERATLVYSLGSPIYIDANSQETIDIKFTENLSQRLVAILEPESSYPTTLLHFDAGNEETSIVDEGGHNWQENGAEIVTNVKKIGAGSLYFDGSAAYISSATSADYELANLDFTVEWWEFRFNADANGTVVARSGASGFVPFRFGVSDGTNSKVYISSSGASFDIANGKTFGAIALNTWVHYAICRSGNNFYMWKDGVLTDSWTSSSSIDDSTADFVLGKNNATYITACIDEFNMIKGFAKYTSAFTPPTEPLSLSGILFNAWTNDDASGTELTSDFSITPTYGAASASVVISNNGEVGGWFNLKVYGRIVESASQITDFQEDENSINAYGYHELAINQVYQPNLAAGRVEAAKILETDKEPKVTLNSVTMTANRNDEMALTFLNTDIGDLVKLKEDQNEIEGAYFIQGYGYKAVPATSGVIVDFTWRVKKFENALSALSIEFFGDNSFAYIDFGNVPSVVSDDVSHRVYSFWVFQTTVQSAPISYVFSTNQGQDIILFDSRVRLIQGFTPPVDNNIGDWRGSTTTFADDVWVHVVISYDNSSASNDPIMYVNNTLQTITELNTPTGTRSSLANSSIRLGMSQVSGGGSPMKGQIKDFRVYDGSQIPMNIGDFADALYNEGGNGTGFTEGLLFHPFYVREDEVSAYEDLELSEDNKLLDAVNLAIGTPVTVAGTNSPIARIP